MTCKQLISVWGDLGNLDWLWRPEVKGTLSIPIFGGKGTTIASSQTTRAIWTINKIEITHLKHKLQLSQTNWKKENKNDINNYEKTTHMAINFFSKQWQTKWTIIHACKFPIIISASTSRIDTCWKLNGHLASTLKNNRHFNNERLNMILFVHFTLNNLTRIELIIWMQKKIVKSDHKIRKHWIKHSSNQGEFYKTLNDK